MPKITVIRHAPALANEQGILMGSKLDSPLSEKGIYIARAKGLTLKSEGYKPDHVYTSKLRRAKQTAGIILDQIGVSLPVSDIELLNERDFGVHDGKPYSSVLQAFDTYGDNPPTIETVTTFVTRVQKAWEIILAESVKDSLVVTHSNPVMVMQCLANNPMNVEKFWELGDPEHCEGFVYEF